MARKRRSYAQRTGANTEAARILARAFLEKPQVIETEEGRLLKAFKKGEDSQYTHEEIRQVLLAHRAVEHDDAREVLPERGIKYAQTKGWMVRDPNGGDWYWPTTKARDELNIPSHTRDGLARYFVEVR